MNISGSHPAARAAQPRPERLQLPTVEAALGYVYVIEGSAIGARAILPEITAALGFDAGRGASFFGGLKEGKHVWQGCLAALDAIDCDAPDARCGRAIGEGRLLAVPSLAAVPGTNDVLKRAVVLTETRMPMTMSLAPLRGRRGGHAYAPSTAPIGLCRPCRAACGELMPCRAPTSCMATTVVTAKNVDLSNCDRELVQFPAAIQGHGAMLIVDESGYIIRQVSENCGALIGIPAEDLLGRSIEDVFRCACPGAAGTAPPHVAREWSGARRPRVLRRIDQGRQYIRAPLRWCAAPRTGVDLPAA